jgi:hypothetical protein
MTSSTSSSTTSPISILPPNLLFLQCNPIFTSRAPPAQPCPTLPPSPFSSHSSNTGVSTLTPRPSSILYCLAVSAVIQARVLHISPNPISCLASATIYQCVIGLVTKMVLTPINCQPIHCVLKDQALLRSHLCPPCPLAARFLTTQRSSGHHLFAAFMLTFKVICDNTYSNKLWSIITQKCVPALEDQPDSKRDMAIPQVITQFQSESHHAMEVCRHVLQELCVSVPTLYTSYYQRRS